MSTINNPIILFVISVIIPSSYSLSFNLSTIGPEHQGRFINVTGDAYITNQGIQVTPNERGVAPTNRTGRATYIDPLHLWDRASGNLTDFTTRFSFVIDSSGNTIFADGLTFFLGPVGSSIQPWSYGGSLGIGNSTVSLNSSAYSFVAVEFDTFRNFFDSSTPGPHIGIDINSMESVNATIWQNNVTLGVQNDAWISYNASSMMLRVEVTGPSGNMTWRDSLSYEVDLRDILPEYVTFGFSAATGALFETHSVRSWQFSSSLEFNVTSEEITPNPAPAPRPRPDPENKNETGLIVGLSVGLSVVVFGVALASYCLRWRKKYKKRLSEYEEEEEEDHPDIDMEFEKGSGAKKFSYNELVIATTNFSNEGKLGEGGFGGVYKGFLRETDSYIAVKRVSKGSKQGLKEYASEVKIISQLRHRNLVQLIGWCHQRGELLLVYEFMPNGSLDSHLFKSKSILSWEVRYKIAQGLASGLLYLHEEWERCVVHRDIKSSNIMLDSNFNAKLGDFGLARLVDHEKGSQTTVLAGTMGYMAPECVITGRASKETDVYSFGVVLLEIACGRRPIEHRNKDSDQVVLVEWVWSLYGVGKLLDGADPNMSTGFEEREIEQLMTVGLWCVHPDSNHRPSIRQAIQVLNFEAPLPILPPELPVPMYSVPSMSSVELNSMGTYSGSVSDSKYSNYSNSSNVTSCSEGKTTALLRTA